MQGRFGAARRFAAAVRGSGSGSNSESCLDLHGVIGLQSKCSEARADVRDLRGQAKPVCLAESFGRR